ncbi:sensor histidine kinase [Actinoplanes sichuanensis]|uniref:histidine kinase n=1 Tax=Actinoplanes sichuanensis TaxID=512349 RepID=A0ABW4A1Z5_9ACTN
MKLLGDATRIAAAEQAAALLANVGVSLDGLCRMAAHLLSAPMAALMVVEGCQEQHLGSQGLPPGLVEATCRPLADSWGACVIGDARVVAAADLSADSDHVLHGHPLAGHGVTALLGVPVRDSDGRPVAALLAFDVQPRHWSDEEALVLIEIAELLTASVWAATGNRCLQVGLDSAALLDSVQEAFIAVDPVGIIRGFNRAAQEMFGYSAAQMCGQSLQEALAPQYGTEPITAALQRLFAARPRRPVRREVSMRHRDGHRISSRAALSVVNGTAGDIAAVFLTDLTAEAAAQQTARRQARFLTALLDSLSVGVIACDDTGRITVMNRALRQVHHHPEVGPVPDNLPTIGSTSVFDTAMRPLAWDQMPVMRAWRGEHLTDVDVLVQVPDERVRTFAATAQPIVGEGGNRLGAVAVAHEVTAQRSTERFRDCHQEIQKTLRGTDSIVEAAPAVLRAVTAALGWPCAELFIVDDDGATLRAVGHYHRDGINPEGFFGHTPIKGRGITGRVWQTGQPLWVPDVGAYTALTTDYERQRVEICTREGIRTILAVPVRDGGTLLGVLTCYAATLEVHEDLLIVLLDGIAAQIAVYVALRRAEELARQLARAQDDFLDLIGHEMRTPLTAITANVGLLAEDVTGLDEEQQQMLDTVTRNTAALRHIVDALLDLSALESGHRQLHLAPVDLSAITDAAVTNVRLTAANAGIRLHTAIHYPVLVTGDTGRLRQVIDDLLSNAVKYSPAGAEVHLSLSIDDQHAELRVTDTGIGIPDTDRGRVYDRFFRAGNVRHHGTVGSGLGLSLARTIVRLHGGTIALAANQPAGTTVCVRLPSADTAS